MKIIQGIIVYDITVPKFRRVLEKSLKDYGRRVQYSVFEFSLEEKIYNKMVKELVMPFYLKNDPEGACKALIKESTKWWENEDVVVDDITVIAIFF